MRFCPTCALPIVLLITAAARASVDDALDALHDAGVNLTSLAADVSLRTTSGDLGDDTVKTGTFAMQKLPGGDTRVRASFTRKQSGNKIYVERRDYLLAGTDLVDRDYAAKKQTTTQVRKPGEKVDLFKLGQGPFPLPVGQPREEVLKQFDVTEEKNTDATALALVKLTPKKQTELASRFDWITVLIDRATKLPKVITTASPGAVDVNTATLTNVRINGAVGDDAFKLEPIKDSEWNLVGNGR